MSGFTDGHSLSDCQMGTFGLTKGALLGEETDKRQKGEIHLMFYEPFKRKSLLLLTVRAKQKQKKSPKQQQIHFINIETIATDWRRP